MPPTRIIMLISAVAAAVAVLSSLVSFTGRLLSTATVVALLAAAAYAVLVIRRPVVRSALVVGIVLLAAVPVVSWVVVDDLPPLLVDGGDIHRIFRQEEAADHLSTLLLVLAAAALMVGVAALPQFRRPAWQTALACVVALVPVAVVGYDVAGPSPYLDAAPSDLWWHLAPGFAATVLAGLALVLAVSRAERWFLLPAGALLVQVTAADWTLGSAGSWALARLYSGVDADAFTTFLSPGLRTEVPAAPAWTVDWEIEAALTTAAVLLGPWLIVLGAARTADAPVAVPAGGEPEQPSEA